MSSYKRRRYDALAGSDDYLDERSSPSIPTGLSHQQDGNTGSDTPTLPRASHLASRYANTDSPSLSIANSGVIDDNVGSQESIEKLFEVNGVDPSHAYHEDLHNGASDIENEVHLEESQSQIVNFSSPVQELPQKPGVSEDYRIFVDDDEVVELGEYGKEDLPFCPHSLIPCHYSEFLLQEYRVLRQRLTSSHNLNDMYERKIYRQNVRLRRLKESLTNAMTLITPANVEGHKLLQTVAELEATKEILGQMQKKQRDAEIALRESERLRLHMFGLVQERSTAELTMINDQFERILCMTY
ncbi:hypothetical protein EV359DRAFT_65795 [Lentinula novae-zelandiae]|nr:hypothetical protein EV359DRAFT_65795 [Lentinula novae-zelandiae]